MKAIRDIITTALALVPLASCVGFPGIGMIGNGKVTESVRMVETFDRVESGGSADVRIHKGPTARVVVTTDENLQEYFEAVVSGETLRLGYKPGVSVIRSTKLVIDVYIPAIEGVAVSGSGDFSILDSFTGESFDTRVSGSGSVKGLVRFERIDASVSGSGSIEFVGSCDSLDLELSGSGSFSGSDLQSRVASATISGSGNATVSVSGRLEASLSGSGSIVYTGSPIVNARVSGSGSIRHAGE